MARPRGYSTRRSCFAQREGRTLSSSYGAELLVSLMVSAAVGAQRRSETDECKAGREYEELRLCNPIGRAPSDDVATVADAASDPRAGSSPARSDEAKTLTPRCTPTLASGPDNFAHRQRLQPPPQQHRNTHQREQESNPGQRQSTVAMPGRRFHGADSPLARPASERAMQTASCPIADLPAQPFHLLLELSSSRDMRGVPCAPLGARPSRSGQR
jgi:hypothetical protein